MCLDRGVQLGELPRPQCGELEPVEPQDLLLRHLPRLGKEDSKEILPWAEFLPGKK